MQTYLEASLANVTSDANLQIQMDLGYKSYVCNQTQCGDASKLALLLENEHTFLQYKAIFSIHCYRTI